MRTDQTIKKLYTVTAGVTAYAVTYPLYEATDVSVYLSKDGGVTESLLTLGTDYSVTIAADNQSSTVTLAPGVAAAGDRLALVSALPYTQELDLSHVSAIDTEATELQLDRDCQQRQQLKEELGRAIKAPVTSTKTGEELWAEFWEAYSEMIDAAEYARRAEAAAERLEAQLKEQEKLRREVDIISGGRQTVRFNKDGVPSIFNRLPMFYLDDIVPSWPHVPHPAFVINDGADGTPHILREILIGSYEAALDNPDPADATCAVSQPGKQPHTYQPFDICLAYCRANNLHGGIRVDYQRSRKVTRKTYKDAAGNIIPPVDEECTTPTAHEYTVTQRDADASLDTSSHFHMMTNAEYAALALWCWKNGYEPSGNSWYGKNHYFPGERGSYPSRRYNYDTGTWENYSGMPNHEDAHQGGITGNCPTMTGSSPNTWRHDGSPAGVENIIGNVSTWAAGLRTYDGQIQIIPNNNAALPDADFCGRVPLSPDGTLDTPADNKQTAKNRQTYYDEPYKGFKALDEHGRFVKPTAGNLASTLKIDGSYGLNNTLTPYVVAADGTITSFSEGDNVPDTSKLYPWGCGKGGVSLAITVRDTGGTDLTPYFWDGAKFVLRSKADGGHPNGSAHVDFDTFAAIADDPSDPSDFTRTTDICPDYMARALLIYPICSHADLFPSVDAAVALDRSETDPVTGDMKSITHTSYYCVLNSYAVVRSNGINAATSISLAATYTARVLFGSETGYRTVTETIPASIAAGGRAVDVSVAAAKTVTGEDLGVTGDTNDYCVDLTSVVIASVSDGTNTFTVDASGDYLGRRAVAGSGSSAVVVQLFGTFSIGKTETALYGEQTGRVFSRAVGDRPVMKGGTYYYERDSWEGEDPRCDLWTTTFGNIRYDLDDAINYAGPTGSSGDYANIKNPSSIGVGWMTGYRLAYYDEEARIDLDGGVLVYDSKSGLLYPAPVMP